MAENTANRPQEYQRKANGKFLLTGEYMVLRGAESLAVPLKMGQSALFVPNAGNAVYWEGFAPGGKWFETAFDSQSLSILTSTDNEKSERLIRIVSEIRKRNPQFFSDGWWARTDLDFDPTFGMGSSSTLLSLLCDAAHVNPYEILDHTFGGSGYDLACAFAQTPIVYSLKSDKPYSTSVTLSSSVTDHILFVYSGNKMVSSGEVKKFSSITTSDTLTEQFTEYTRKALQCTDIETFCDILKEHENVMGNLLGKQTLNQQFPDFGGTLKSMGAWGGDFFMAIADDIEAAKNYFLRKGFGPVYTYGQIVLS